MQVWPPEIRPFSHLSSRRVPPESAPLATHLTRKLTQLVLQIENAAAGRPSIRSNLHSHSSIVSVRPLPLSLARCCQQALLLCMPLAAAAASNTVAVGEPTCRRPMEGSTCFFFSILRAFPFVARSSVAPAGPSALLHCIALGARMRSIGYRARY